MSFSYQVKSEICKAPVGSKSCALCECYGILLSCHTFSRDLIRIVTEHRDFSARLPKLLKKAFSLEFDVQPAVHPEGEKATFILQDPEKLRVVFSAFGQEDVRTPALHLNRAVLENNDCEVAFVRGAFLSGGSVTDPEKRYHLEFTTTHSGVCGEIYSLLLDLGFAPKDAKRNGAALLYFKQSDQIEDMLTLMDAPVSAMAVMEAKLEKDMRNRVNRRCNCDDANSSKTADAVRSQRIAIEKLRACGRLEHLSPTLQETALARESNLEASLSELATILNVTKSAVNHRIRKLMQLAEQEEGKT